MIELFLVACLMREPARCEEYFVPTAEPLSLMGCMVMGQQQLARWLEQHPGWLVRRWRCGFQQA